MDDNANTTASVVDNALFEDLFKAARRGALNTEPTAVVGDAGRAVDWVAASGPEDSSTRPDEPTGQAARAGEPAGWPSDDPDRATADPADDLPAASPLPPSAATPARPQGVSAVRDEPAQTGWRNLVSRLTLGVVRPRPGKAEQRLRAARAVMRSSLDRPLTVVFAHPEAAARECGITLRAAHAFGAARGGSVLAWAVGTSGMAGVPAAQDPPAAPLASLVADLDLLRGNGTRLTDLARFTQPQPTGVDVLPGDGVTEPDPRWFATAHDVLGRFYTVVCVEVDGDLPAHSWAAVADVLVLCGTATTASVDAAVGLAAELRAAGHDALVDRAIGVVYARDKTSSVALRMLGDRVRAELTSVLTVGHRRKRRDDELVNRRRPAPNDPVWTFLGASIIDSSVNAIPTREIAPSSQR